MSMKFWISKWLFMVPMARRRRKILVFSWGIDTYLCINGFCTNSIPNWKYFTESQINELVWFHSIFNEMLKLSLIYINFASLFEDPCKLPLMDERKRECNEMQPQRGYIAGIDFVIFCDRIPSQLADGNPCSACFRAFDKLPRLWKCNLSLTSSINSVQVR